MTYKHTTTGIKATLCITDNKYYIQGCTIGVSRNFIEFYEAWEEIKYSLSDMTKMANHWAYIKGQPKNSNVLKIIESWK